MVIHFYNVKKDKFHINRADLNNPLYTVDCELKDIQEVLRPVLRLKYNTLLEECNYFWIPAFKRVYDRTSLSVFNQQATIGGVVDALNSHLSEVHETSAMIDRAESDRAYTKYVQDPEAPVYSYRRILTKKAASDLNKTGSFVLTVV